MQPGKHPGATRAPCAAKEPTRQGREGSLAGMARKGGRSERGASDGVEIGIGLRCGGGKDLARVSAEDQGGAIFIHAWEDCQPSAPKSTAGRSRAKQAFAIGLYSDVVQAITVYVSFFFLSNKV